MEKIFEIDLKSKDFQKSTIELIHQLRSHITTEEIINRLNIMVTEGYKLWGYSLDNQLLGLVSTRLYTDLVRGTHIYIDDLVVDSNVQSQGIGACLLEHVEKYGKEKNIKSFRLSCAIENQRGMKFYEREGWKVRTSTLVKKGNQPN